MRLPFRCICWPTLPDSALQWYSRGKVPMKYLVDTVTISAKLNIPISILFLVSQLGLELF